MLHCLNLYNTFQNALKIALNFVFHMILMQKVHNGSLWINTKYSDSERKGIQESHQVVRNSRSGEYDKSLQ